MTTITPNMIDAVKVQFLKPIFEEDFPERGMKAWLTRIEWDNRDKSYKLFFDFTEFEAENDKYFACKYYANRHTGDIARETGRTLFTAKEAGLYHPKYSVYFSCQDSEDRNDTLFSEEILEYLRVVE